MLEDVNAAHLRHADVHNQQVRRHLAEPGQDLAPTVGLSYVIALAFEEGAQEVNDGEIVICYEYPFLGQLRHSLRRVNRAAQRFDYMTTARGWQPVSRGKADVQG